MALNCKKGTPCGGACIRRGSACKKEFNQAASKSLDNVKKKIGLGVKIRNAQRKGDASEEAKLRVQREALSNRIKLNWVKDKKPDSPAKEIQIPKDPPSGKSDVVRGANAQVFAAKARVDEVQARGVRAALRKDDASFDRAVKELVVAKEQLKIAELGRERVDLIGNREPAAIKRRAELADEIARARYRVADQMKAASEARRSNAPQETKLPSARADLAAMRREKLAKYVNASGEEKQKLSKEIDRLDKVLGVGSNGATKVSPAAPVRRGWTSEDRVAKERSAQFFDDRFKPEKTVTGSKDSINWDETVKNAKEIGSGSFGTVRMSPDGKYVVKRGEVSTNEAALIKRLGEADLGPKLIVGETGPKTKREFAVQLHDGRIAMTVVPGKPIGRNGEYTEKVGDTTVGNAYWKARADLHRLGIAHNDAHPENVFIDEKGKGRWVDMGLAQASPKAALSEALGSTPPPQGARGFGRGDWQGTRWSSQTGLDESMKVRADAPENLKQIHYNAQYVVAPFLRMKGLSDDEIGDVATHGIRQGVTTYKKGAWAKITDEDAAQAIDLLYEGVK